MEKIARLAIVLVVLTAAAALCAATRAPGASEESSLDKIYGDESHCLAGSEIRNESDRAISCYCRDALVDVRYVYQTYILTGKDDNLTGAALSLEAHARDLCGNNSFLAAEKDDWQWIGPEVTRTYPPSEEIKQIPPDAKGFRRVPYKVRLTYRSASGAVLKREDYVASYLDGPLNSRIKP